VAEGWTARKQQAHAAAAVISTVSRQHPLLIVQVLARFRIFWIDQQSPIFVILQPYA